MSVCLNHTIVWCKDHRVSATFLADTLGLAAPTRFGPFLVVTAANNVSLDFQETDAVVSSQHYAFLVTEDDFDEIFGRITGRGLDYWADPGQSRLHEINHNDGGRGVYFPDPDGHMLEIFTRPYGSGSESRLAP
jgi:catechol 2,3-dioxygenase-like lactoylglutathione lyase family enzyme